jgi:hypothetical protein
MAAVCEDSAGLRGTRADEVFWGADPRAQPDGLRFIYD